jgi:hypothetical protein
MVVVVLQEDQEAEPEQDDEITSLLLKHEKSNKQPAAVIPGDESDSDNRSASGILFNIFSGRYSYIFSLRVIQCCFILNPCFL